MAAKKSGIRTTLLRFSMGLVGLCTLVVAAQAAESAGMSSREPVVWGLASSSKGCVIFREYKKTKVGFWVVAVTTKTHAELEVIEALDYQLDQKVWIEDEDSMNELQRLAMKDSIRYVKIQDKYSPEELEAARALCIRTSVVGH